MEGEEQVGGSHWKRREKLNKVGNKEDRSRFGLKLRPS